MEVHNSNFDTLVNNIFYMYGLSLLHLSIRIHIQGAFGRKRYTMLPKFCVCMYNDITHATCNGQPYYNEHISSMSRNEKSS